MLELGDRIEHYKFFPKFPLRCGNTVGIIIGILKKNQGIFSATHNANTLFDYRTIKLFAQCPLQLRLPATVAAGLIRFILPVMGANFQPCLRFELFYHLAVLLHLAVLFSYGNIQQHLNSPEWRVLF